MTSTMAAEVIALMEGVTESAPLRELTRYPVRLLCDNQAAIRVVSQGHSKAVAAYVRPLRLRMAALKDMVELEQVDVVYIPSKDNVSDLLTKVFARFEQARLARLVGMRTEDRVGDLVNKDGTWVVPDPGEEAEERKERDAQKQIYIREAMERKAGAVQGDDTPLDIMD